MPGNKPLYHAAGALAAGHALVVVEAAVQLLMSLGIKRSRGDTRASANDEASAPELRAAGPARRLDRTARARRL